MEPASDFPSPSETPSSSENMSIMGDAIIIGPSDRGNNGIASTNSGVFSNLEKIISVTKAGISGAFIPMNLTMAFP